MEKKKKRVDDKWEKGKKWISKILKEIKKERGNRDKRGERWNKECKRMNKKIRAELRR